MSSQPTVTDDGGVAAVRSALDAMAKGTGDFEAVKAAVSTARFTPKVQPQSLDDLADRWDYAYDPNTWNDTVQAAYFMKVIDSAQYRELSALAQFQEVVTA